MRKISAALIALAVAMFTANIDSNACTNVLVTKGASTDGSNMVSYAADSHQLYGELYYAPAGVWKAGDMQIPRTHPTGGKNISKSGQYERAPAHHSRDHIRRPS